MLIKPTCLKGTVQIPPSKSVSHRAIICAALAKGVSIVDNLILSDDIIATIDALRLLGADIKCENYQLDRYRITVHGGLQVKDRELKVMDCKESGSTLRFLIPIAAALGAHCQFVGRGRLGERPLDTYYDIFKEQQFSYTTTKNKLPLTISSQLKPLDVKIRGDISSQFITGLLFALPTLEGDSTITITTDMESKGYIDLTLQVLRDFGIVINHEQYKKFFIKGGQSYKAHDYTVEGDYSQAAFWLVAGCLGNDIVCQGLNPNSLQSDKAILKIIEDMDGKVSWLDEYTVKAEPKKTTGTVIDVADCPDIAPILTVLASLSNGCTQIINAGRLRIKESDRITSTTTELSKLGARIKEEAESMQIEGRESFVGCVDLDAWNDHRIAMAIAIACTRNKDTVRLEGASSVKKSYPRFWQDYLDVGGEIEGDI